MGKKWSQGPDRFSGRLNNHKLTMGASETVTYHSGSGTDSISSPYDIYLNMEREVLKITIRATVACNLTQLDGETLKSPLTINPGVNVIDIRATQFKIVSIGSTVLEVTVK